MGRPLLDVLPARVTSDRSTDTLTKARVHVDNGLMRIFVSARGGGVALVREEAVASVEKGGARTAPSKVVLASGEVLSVQKSGGCACGSALKRFQPARWGQ